MFSIPIPSNTSLRDKAPYIMANAIYFFAGIGMATSVIALTKTLGAMTGYLG